MTEQEILAGLAEIVNEVAGTPVDDITPEKSFIDDLDIDSLSMVEVVMAAEDKFGVNIPDGEVKTLRTVGDAVAYIQQAPASPPDRTLRTGVRGRRPAVRAPATRRSRTPAVDRHAPQGTAHATAPSSSPGSAPPPPSGATSRPPGSRCSPAGPASGLIEADWAADLPVPASRPRSPSTRSTAVSSGSRRAGSTAPSSSPLIAAREAWADAGTPEVDPDRLGVVVGTGIGGVVSLLDAVRHPAGAGAGPGLPHDRPDAHAQRRRRLDRPRARRPRRDPHPGLRVRLRRRGGRRRPDDDPQRPRGRRRRRRHRGRRSTR